MAYGAVAPRITRPNMPPVGMPGRFAVPQAPVSGGGFMPPSGASGSYGSAGGSLGGSVPQRAPVTGWGGSVSAPATSPFMSSLAGGGAGAGFLPSSQSGASGGAPTVWTPTAPANVNMPAAGQPPDATTNPWPWSSPKQEYQDRGGNPFQLGGGRFFRKLRKNAPPWLQDQGVFAQGMGNLNEILASKGAVDPAVLYRMQADAEVGRRNAREAILNNAAASGMSPDDPRVQTQLAAADGAANRALAEGRRTYDIMAEERKRTDLAQLYPFMSALLQLTGKGGGQLTTGAAAPSYRPDYAGAAGTIIGDVGSALINRQGAQG